MRRLTAALSLLLTLHGLATAGTAPDRAKDEAATRAVIANLNDARTKGDARLWGEQFAEDADFTAWMGAYVKGREVIAGEHARIFQTIYKGTKLRLGVRSIRFLRDDVAVVPAEGAVAKKGEEFPPTPQVVPAVVLTKEKGRWRIAVFQNTLVQSREGAKQ